MLRVAASRSRTTRTPIRPSLTCTALSRTHSAKWATTPCSASPGSMCGLHMSPVRYPTLSRCASSAADTSMPRSYTLTGSDGFSSLKITLFLDPATIICRT